MLYKEILRKNHTWLAFIENLKGANDVEKNYLAWMIVSNKEILKRKSELISPYQKFNNKLEFEKMLLLIITRHKEEKLINKYLNKTNRDLLVDHKTFGLFFDLFVIMGEENFKKLIKPNLFATTNPTEFNAFLSHYIKWHNKWNKDNIFNIINEKKLNVKICLEEENFLIVEIEDFKAASNLGTLAWCISRENKYFESHRNSLDKLYFIYDFNKKQYDKTSLMGITIPMGPTMRFKYSFNNANEAQKDLSFLSKMEQVFYKEPFNEDNFKKGVSLIKDPCDQFLTFYEMKYYDDAEFLLKQTMLKETEDDFLIILSRVLFGEKDYNFIYSFIRNFDLNKKEKEFFVGTIGELIVEMGFDYDKDFIKEIFKEINERDLEFCFLRKLLEKSYSSSGLVVAINHFKNNIMKEENIDTYMISYIFNVDNENLLKEMCKQNIFKDIDIDFLKRTLKKSEFTELNKNIKNNYKRKNYPYLKNMKLIEKIKLFFS